MYLELAENGINPLVSQNYTFLPSNVPGQSGTWVRDDYFDNLTDSEFDEISDTLEPFQPMSETANLAGLGDWIKKKRDLRAQRKEAKIELIKAKGQGITSGTFQPGGAFQNILGTVAQTASNIFGGGGGGGTPAPTETETPFYKNPLVLIGGAALIGGIIFLSTRKKTK